MITPVSGSIQPPAKPQIHGNEAHDPDFEEEGVAAGLVGSHEAAADPHTGYIKHSLATAVKDFLVASGAGVFAKKTSAEVLNLLNVVRTATYVIAASDAPDEWKAQADAVCTGTNDHLYIQGGLDAGYDVKLSPGHFYNEVGLALDSYNMLRGCGRSSILTTTTEDDEDMIILSAVGSSGNEKTGIVITDLQVDCAGIGSAGIYFEYVDYSLIQDVYVRRTDPILDAIGIRLWHSDFNTIKGNVVREHPYFGIQIRASNDNVAVGNTCQGNADGFALSDASSHNTIIGNVCTENVDFGITLSGSVKNTIIGNDFSRTGPAQGWGIGLWNSSNNNTILCNDCQGCYKDGIYLNGSHHNNISSNNCLENSQEATNTYDDIRLENSDYNNIQGNICRAGTLEKKPRYGINISGATCNGNKVGDNDLYDDGFGTGLYNNAGTLTRRIQSADIEVSELGEATYDDLQDFINNTVSAGRTSGGVLTASGGAGNVSVASGTGFIKVTPGDPNSETKSFDWDALVIEAGVADGTIKDGVVNYIYIDYNAGSPIPKATDDRTAIDLNSMFTLGRAYRAGATTAHVINSGTNLYDHIRVNHERLIAVRGFERASGGVASQVGERYLSTTAGVFYLGANKVETNLQNTSGNGHSLTHWYHDGGGNWVPDATAQGDSLLGQVDNDNYDSGTGLTPIGVAKYGVYWVFIHMDSDIHVVYGRDSYNLADAENTTVPAIPDALRYFAILAAKIIVVKNAANFTSIVTAYETLFPVSSPPNHNDLGGIQGGAADDYYHLTAANRTALLAHPDLTTDVHGVGASTIVGTALTQTITNKRNKPRVSSAASGNISPSVATADMYIRTVQAAALTINNPIGGPAQGEKFIFRLKDNGTARAITFGSQYRALEHALPTTTVAGKTMYLGFIFNSTDTKWDMVAINEEA